MRDNIKKKQLFMIFMGGLLVCICMISISFGQIKVPIYDTVQIIGSHLGIPGVVGEGIDQGQEAVIWHIRTPRVLVGLLAGAALAIAGAVMQGLFNNSLADPGIIGISGGASLGAVVAIALGLTAKSLYYMPLFALVGAVAALSVAVMLSMKKGKIPVMVLLLAGITVSSFMLALTSGILTVMNENSLREYIFWMVGGLDYRRWEHVYLASGPISMGIILLCIMARHINIMALGDDEAKSVGAAVVTLRMILLFISALMTTAAVCVSGSIGFVGLIIPHMMRILLGPDHRILLPASAIAGALFLVSCDLIGRTIIPTSEIRVGVITSIVGAPYFLYLLHRMQQGGVGK